MLASLEHRYRQVPPGRFSWGLALLPDTSLSPMLAFHEVEGATGHNEWTTTCDQAEGELAEACRHLATLVLRDAVWSHDVLEAVAVMEQVGTSSDRADAAARERDVDWLAINVGKTIRDESALINEPRYALAAFGDMEAMRALLRAGGIATRPPADWTPSSEQ